MNRFWNEKKMLIMACVFITGFTVMTLFGGMDQKLSKDKNAIYKWTFESTSDRIYARDYTADDIGRLAKQADDGTIWMLTATTPTWKQMDSTGTSVGALIVAGTSKTTPVDADTLAISNSQASGILAKLTWANLKATLKAYFDTLYQDVVIPSAAGNVARISIAGKIYDGGIPAGTGDMMAAVPAVAGNLPRLAISGQIYDGDTPGKVITEAMIAAAAKEIPVDADNIAITNSESSHVLSKLTWANLKATLKSYLDTLYNALAIPAAAGNIAKISITGQIYDGGTWNSQFTAQQLLALAAIEAATKGAMLYHDGTGWGVLPAGTEGQVIKMNAAGLPAWGADAVE